MVLEEVDAVFGKEGAGHLSDDSGDVNVEGAVIGSAGEKDEGSRSDA